MKHFYLLLSASLFGCCLNAQIYSTAFKVQSSGSDKGSRITTDIGGNVITTGSFGGSADFDPGTGAASLTPNGFSEDVYVAKYNSALNYIWAVKFGTSGSDFSYALATDASGNVIVGGDVSSNSRDGFVNKYDVNGNLTWSMTIGGINKDVVYGVSTDAARNVYVTGYFENTVDFDPGASSYTLASKGGRDIFLAKYDSTGKFRWAFNMGGTISTAYEEGGRDLAVKGANVYLTGSFEGTADFNPASGSNTLMSNGSLDMFVAKYDTSGAYQWAINMGSANKHDYSYALAIDAAENVYITGGFEETVDFDPSPSTATLVSASVSAQDIFVAKYNSSGAYQWAFQVGGNTPVDDHAFDIDVSSSGDLYISGEVWGPADFDPSAGVYNITPSNDQIFFARYTTGGSFVWAFDVGSTSGNGSADNGYGIHASAAGALYVTGDYSGTADFDPSIGTATLSASGSDAFIGMYGAAVFVGVNSISQDDKTISVFPNPSSGLTKFVFSEFNGGLWDLRITDLNGRVKLNFENLNTDILTLQRGHLEPGLYLCTVRYQDKTVTKKLIIQ